MFLNICKCSWNSRLNLLRPNLVLTVIVALVFMLHSAPLSAEEQAKGETVYRSYFYGGLTGYQQSLFQGFIVSEFPSGKTVNQIMTNEASLRSVTRLAEALLYRNEGDDLDNAEKILRWILKNQYTDAKSEYYGMWKTNVLNDRHDQNWREFVGCDLIIIYNFYQQLLPADLLEGIKTGLIHAAKGALKRNVGADYTNISVMSAFLMDYVGNTFGINELKVGGLQKASEIYQLFNRHQTFSEYNSPTYYGVTLIGLALWRELASGQVKKMGLELEEALWTEIGSNYHPRFRNLTGPYFRAYGMDMRKYYSIAGIWIAVALDAEKLAPLPRGKGVKEEELSNIAPILHLGLSIPKSVLLALKDFTAGELTERLVPSKITGDTLKRITTMVSPNWTMGGLWGNLRVWNQIKAGTIHWQNSNSETEWLLVPGDGKTNVRVTKTSMNIFRADEKVNSFSLYIFARDLKQFNIADKIWKFPAMELTVNTKLRKSWNRITDPKILYESCAISEEYPAVLKITFQVPANWRKEDVLVEIIPNKN